MATRVYGTNQVLIHPDVARVPSAALDDEGRRLLGAFDDLGAKMRTHEDAAAALRAKPAEERSAVAAAGARGSKAPTMQDPAYYEAAAQQEDEKALECARGRLAAAEAFEAHVRTSPAVAEALGRDIADRCASLCDSAPAFLLALTQLRELGAIHRELSGARAYAEAATPPAGEARRQAVFDAFRAAHQSDQVHADAASLTKAIATIRQAVEGFPFAIYEATSTDDLVAAGEEAQRLAAFTAQGIVTEEQRRQAALDAAGARPTMPKRPFVKTAGHLTADEVKGIADRRRADNAPH